LSAPPSRKKRSSSASGSAAWSTSRRARIGAVVARQGGEQDAVLARGIGDALQP
jgi:hypothetical protein